MPPLLPDAYPSDSDMMSVPSVSGLQQKAEDDIEVVSISSESLLSVDLSAEATENVSMNHTVENNTEAVENIKEGEMHMNIETKTFMLLLVRLNYVAFMFVLLMCICLFAVVMDKSRYLMSF